MSSSVRRKIRQVLESEEGNGARLDGGVWTTKCLHCRSRLSVNEDDESPSPATLEHIVPRSWFAGDRCFVSELEGADDLKNLAIACARCNHDKGKQIDVRGDGDQLARNVVIALLRKRASRRSEH